MNRPVDTIAPACAWHVERNGSFALRDSSGQLVSLRGRKGRAIIAFLSSHPDKPIGRDRLIELLWADRGEEQARGSLRQSLFEIRRLAPELISSDYHHVWIDSSHLLENGSAGQSEDAVLFADLNGVTSDFDDWLRAERAYKATEEWKTLQTEVEKLLARQKSTQAIPLIERMEQIDPYNEDGLRLAMRAEAQAGHTGAIQKRYAEFAETLKRELGVAPALETRDLRDRLLADLTSDRSKDEIPGEAVVRPANVVIPRRSPWLALAGGATMLVSLGLTQSATSAAPAYPTIAVLPFQAIGIEAALADGFSDELLTQLVRNGGLRVIGRTAFADVRSTPEGLKSFRRELGVEYIVEGKVAPEGKRLRVLVSLVRTKDAKTMWAERFEGSDDKLQAIQAAIGSAVGRSLSTNAPPFSQKTTNGEAYALYLRAKGLIRDRNQEGFRSAAQLLDAALKADPTFAAAWAQLATNTRLAKDYFTFPDPTKPGAVMTPVQGAQRALDLDPNLSEAHAIMAMAARLDTPGGRAHLRKALALDPRDSQTLYWAGMGAMFLGNFRLANDFFQRSAALDPLAKRPLIPAGVAAIESGDRATAERYLRTIKARNPNAASEVEITYLTADGDFSSAAALATKEMSWHTSWDSGTDMAKAALLGIGLRNTPFGPHTPLDRQLAFGKMPDRSWLLSQAKDWTAVGAEWDFYGMTYTALAREGRWNDIVAIHDQSAALLTNGDPGGRYMRVSYGGITALALKKVGRDREAVRVALATEEAVKTTLSNGEVPAEVLATIAQAEAVLGHHDAALTHLEEAYSKGWRMALITMRYMDPADDPTFATLRGNPRFERINRQVKAHKAKERKEFLAFTKQSSWSAS